MFFDRLFASNKSILGVDIGTSSIKIAQITHGKNPVLDTYGIVNIDYQLGAKDDDAAVQQMAGIFRRLLEKAGVTAKKCVISFPNSSVFTSVIQLPKMEQDDLASSVEFEAKKYVPLALSEVDLSWTLIGESGGPNNSQKVLITAVPKQVTKNYLKVFELAGLQPKVGEIEALALIRGLIGNTAANCVIIDIGARSTGLNIIENGFLRLSRNLSIGGDTITDKIAQSLNISHFRAEQFKRDFGVSNATFIPDAIKPVLSIIKGEVKQLLAIYQSQNVQLDKVLLVGGGSCMPGIVEYFEDINIKVELGDPLKSVGYAANLQPILTRYSLSLPIAIGLALRKD